MNIPEGAVQRVVCAAVRHGDIVVCSARHADALMHSQLKAHGLRLPGCEQGFIDQFCNFLTREQAREIAKANGQIIRRCGGDETRLFSENLY